MSTHSPVKVLVVENNPTILKLLEHHLKAAGCSLQSATNGLEALLALENFLPDILFTDIIMPKVSGDQLCSILRKNPQYSDLFIAVHSSTSLEDNRGILDIDADVYIAKGPTRGMKEHVDYVLDQYTKGVRKNRNTIFSGTLHPREITRELLLARRHSLAIFNSIAEAVVEIDSNGIIVQANLATEKLLQLTTIEILSRPFTSFLKQDGQREIQAWIDNVHITAQHQRYSSEYTKPLLINGKKILLDLVAINENEDFFIIGILQDITRQKKTEEVLEDALARINAIIDNIDYGVIFIDAQFRSLIVNQAFKDLFEVPEAFFEQDLTPKQLLELLHDKEIHEGSSDTDDDDFTQWITRIQKGSLPMEELHLPNGRILQFQCVALPNGGRLLTFYDITSMKETEKKLEQTLAKVSRLANHDTLTGLPNLRLAQERLLSTIALAKRKKWMAALMFIDLDGFKEINDTYGHDMGDKVLIIVAERLSRSIRGSDTAARVGGDEFLIIQTEVPDRDAVASVAEKIISKISDPMFVEGHEIQIGASIGIAIYPENGHELKVLMKRADDAMYYTKRIGKNGFTFSPK